MSPAPWPDLIPVEEQVEALPFPTDALPLWLRSYIRAQAASSQLPEDMIGMLSLSALSTALQGRVNVHSSHGNWVEPITLYTATTAPPAERKSAAFARVYEPLLEWESEIQEIEWPMVSQSQNAYKELELAIDKADRRVQKMHTAWMDLRRVETSTPDSVRKAEGDLEVARQEATDARIVFSTAKPHYKMRLVYNDLTPEAAATNLSEQFGERISVISDEGGVFEVLSGSRYSDRLNLDVFLKGHGGNIVLVDRIGRDSERIVRPMITLGLAIQPSVLTEIGKSKQMYGRGLLARFLYAVPSPAVGGREVRVDGVPAEIRGSYGASMKALCGSGYAQREIKQVGLTEGAQELLYQVQERIEPRLKPEVGDLSEIGDWAGKLAGAILRIATLIACARHSTIVDVVEEEDMAAGMAFQDYLIAHAFRAYTMMGLISISEGENRIVKKIRRDNLTQFKSRDMYRTLNAHRTHKSVEFEVYLEELANMGYIRKVVDSAKPPIYHWDVNPAVLADNADSERR